MALVGIWKAFQVVFVRKCLLGCLLRYLVKSLVFNGTIFESITVKQCQHHLGIPMTWNHLEHENSYITCYTCQKVIDSNQIKVAPCMKNKAIYRLFGIKVSPFSIHLYREPTILSRQLHFPYMERSLIKKNRCLFFGKLKV